MENYIPNPTATIPTLQIKERKTQPNPKMGHHSVPVHVEPAAAACGFRRKAHRRLTRRKKTIDFKEQQKKKKKKKVQVMSSGDQEEEEKAELERKIVALQKIVPGGESLGVDKLFEETAEYILALQCQIKAMKVLSNFIEGFEKEKRKNGG